jgi:hypothetical protein
MRTFRKMSGGACSSFRETSKKDRGSASFRQLNRVILYGFEGGVGVEW